MIGNTIVQVGLYLAVLVGLSVPLGSFMAAVFEGKRTILSPLLGWLEQLIYRVSGIDPKTEMSWTRYAVGILSFNAVGLVSLYLLLRFQDLLPLNPEKFVGMSPLLALNTAVSFSTNTNWQSYGGETTLSPLSQMLGLSVHNFLSAATGMAVLAALIRGFVRREGRSLGNCWADLTRSTIYVLLPLSTVLALLLVSQGVVQTFTTQMKGTLVDTTIMSGDNKLTEQTFAMGPVASQIAIKQLGTNGGGYFNVNSAHPFENPTAFSNFLEVLAILLLPAALCYTFGVMVGDRRQGWGIMAAMLTIFIPLIFACTAAEQASNPLYAELGLDDKASATQSGGNMEGKETRFGIVNSALWATATTAASNGSVNAMHDSFTPLGGLVPMWLMQLGEVVFGGIGSGLYGMLIFAVLAVFIAGLMVGRTPEYLGKKIEAFDMKMASLVILFPPAVVLIGTAIAVMGPGLHYLPIGASEPVGNLANPGAHGFSEVLYAFSSAGNNNGSAFAGLSANADFYNIALSIAMLISRYWLIIPTLALAGSLVRKKWTPVGAGTLPTHTPLFVVMLVGVVLLVGALTFVPALALGPVVEQLQMTSK